MKYYHKYIPRLLKSIQILTVVSVFSISALTPRIASALIDRKCDQGYLRNLGVINLSCVENLGCSEKSNPVAVSLDGNDNAEKTFRFFVSKGLTKEQAAGITGNAIAESGINPKSVSKSGGFSGMFQWDTRGRFANLKKWTAQNNLDPLSLDGQLQFAWYEADSRGDIEGIKKQPSVELAAWYWGRFFEVAIIGGSTSKTPLTNVQALQKRIDGGKQTLATYGASVQSTAGSTPTITSTAPSLSPNCGPTTGAGEDTKYIDGFTVYSQYDPAWKNAPYSSSTIGESGCGPSAMAMIITTLTGKTVKPTDTANYAASKGIYVPGAGSGWNIAPVLAQNWGLKATPIGKDLAKITQTLQSGGLVITSGKGPVPFSTGGHYIVIRAVTASGKFLVGDSAHKDANTKEWDPQQILNGMPGGSTYAITK